MYFILKEALEKAKKHPGLTAISAFVIIMITLGAISMQNPGTDTSNSGAISMQNPGTDSINSGAILLSTSNADKNTGTTSETNTAPYVRAKDKGEIVDVVFISPSTQKKWGSMKGIFMVNGAVKTTFVPMTHSTSRTFGLTMYAPEAGMYMFYNAESYNMYYHEKGNPCIRFDYSESKGKDTGEYVWFDAPTFGENTETLYMPIRMPVSMSTGNKDTSKAVKFIRNPEGRPRCEVYIEPVSDSSYTVLQDWSDGLQQETSAMYALTVYGDDIIDMLRAMGYTIIPPQNSEPVQPRNI